MKTIARLIIFAAFAVLPFTITAQENESAVKKDIVNPEWFEHLLGKTMEESIIECDSIKWLYIDRSGWDTPYSVYVVNRGDHLGKYVLYFKKESNVPDSKATLVKIVCSDKIGRYIKQFLAGEIHDEAYFLRQAGIRDVPSASERVWLEFWNRKFKEDVKREVKKELGK